MVYYLCFHFQLKVHAVAQRFHLKANTADAQGLINVRERANKGYLVHGKAFALA